MWSPAPSSRASFSAAANEHRRIWDAKHMTRTQSLLMIMLAAAPAALGGLALAAQDRYTLQVPGGLAFSEFRGYEDWQTVAVSHNGDKLAIILGNPALIDAYKSGIPSNGKPFPDGAKFAKIHWTAKKDESQPGEPIVPGALHDTDFMVKDSKRFADSGGWGYAQFDYDTAPSRSSPAMKIARRRRSTTPNAASPATRSWRTRITFSPPIRGGESVSAPSGRGPIPSSRRLVLRAARGAALEGRSKGCAVSGVS
jgi:hypothetical protein